MNTNSDKWIGFKHLENLGISSDKLADYEVLCLPENIEIETDPDKLIEAGETVHLYKILRSQGIKVYSLQDFGYDVPSYERRGDTIYFGVIVIQFVVLPIVTAIIANWITEKIFHKSIKIKIHVVKEGNETQIDYNGDGETLLKILKGLKG